MKHRLLAICLIVLAIFAAQPSVLFCLAERDILETEAYFDHQESLSGLVDVPYRGNMFYYAQNDSLWKTLVYETRESQKSRPFGDGGCAPTSLAIILANIVPAEQLDDILDYGVRPFSLCEHHINSNKCSYKRCRERYELNTPELLQKNYEDYKKILAGEVKVN